MTLSMTILMTLSMTTFSKMTLSIMSLFATLSISDTQHNGYRVPSVVMLSVAFFIVMLSIAFFIVMLSVIMLNVIMLNVAAPYTRPNIKESPNLET